MILLNKKQVKVNFKYEKEPSFIRKRSNKELEEFLKYLNSKSDFLVNVESDNFDLVKVNTELNNKIEKTDGLFKLYFIKNRSNIVILRYNLKDFDLKDRFKEFCFEYFHFNNEEAEKRAFITEIEICNDKGIVVEKIVFTSCVFLYIEEKINFLNVYINCFESMNYYVLSDLYKLKKYD